MVVPLLYDLIDEKEMAIDGGMFLLEQEEQNFTINHKAIIAIGQKFSAPVIINHKSYLPDDKLDYFLARYNPDPVNRWQVLLELIYQEIKNIAIVSNYNVNNKILDILSEIAVHKNLHPALLALYLTMPNVRDVPRFFSKIAISD